VIAVDAMGGDFAPDVVVQGALNCAKTTGIPIILFGPQTELQARLEKIDVSWKQYSITLSDAQQHITMDEEPVQVVRKKPNSSLVRAVASVQDGTCKAVLSAGNSGAMLAASLFLLGRNKGVKRPALVGFLPRSSGATVCLDLGANVDCKPEYLYQFAHLGVQYAKDMLGIKKPLVGLLANGQEPNKGSKLTKDAFALLQNSSLHFIGNVEPEHVVQSGSHTPIKVDVVVCDGFVGNILLKTFEATVTLCCAIAKNVCEKTSLKIIADKQRMIGKQGGALLVGVQKPVVIVHGGASADDIERAILFAHETSSKINVEKYCVGL